MDLIRQMFDWLILPAVEMAERIDLLLESRAFAARARKEARRCP